MINDLNRKNNVNYYYIIKQILIFMKKEDMVNEMQLICPTISDK